MWFEFPIGIPKWSSAFISITRCRCRSHLSYSGQWQIDRTLVPFVKNQPRSHYLSLFNSCPIECVCEGKNQQQLRRNPFFCFQSFLWRYKQKKSLPVRKAFQVFFFLVPAINHSLNIYSLIFIHFNNFRICIYRNSNFFYSPTLSKKNDTISSWISLK